MPDTPAASEVIIQGITADGRAFRPSDWAERLAGVMAQFRPAGMTRGGRLAYSPWCVPSSIDDVKVVIVSTELRAHEPMAWDFVMNFARDNGLQVSEACVLPDAPAPTPLGRSGTGDRRAGPQGGHAAPSLSL